MAHTFTHPKGLVYTDSVAQRPILASPTARAAINVIRLILTTLDASSQS